MLLTKTKQGYIKENGRIVGTEKRIENIDRILNDNDLLNKLVDIKLINDILWILEDYNYKEQGHLFTSGQNLLLASISNRVEVNSGHGLVIDGKSQIFSNPEELRKYLYDLVGFEYQSHEEANKVAEQDIVDPLAKTGFDSPDTIFNYLDDINSISAFKTPKHKEETKVDITFKVGQIRKELEEITSYLAGVTAVEELGSNGLPNNTREVIFKSISRMLKLQKELAMLEIQLGSNVGMDMELLEENDEYWQSMVNSCDYYRSHHNSI